MALIGTVLWRAFPWIIDRYNQGDYKPALGAAWCLGMLLWQAPTWDLTKRLLPRRPEK